MLSLTLLWLIACAATTPASRPAAPACVSCADDSLLPPGTVLPAVDVRASSLPASAPASRPAGRDVPVYTRAEMAAVLKVAERDKGAIAAQRDEALTKASLAEAFGRKLEQELAAANVRARWLPWVVGAGCVLFGAAVGAIVGAVLEHRAHAELSPAQPTQNAPLELLAAPTP